MISIALLFLMIYMILLKLIWMHKQKRGESAWKIIWEIY